MIPVEIDFGILPAIRKFSVPLRRTFDDLIIVGLGGSSLGTKALIHALGPFKKRVFFLDNLDSFLFESTVRKIRWPRALFLIISKSGETIETLTLFRSLLRLCLQKKLLPKKHFVVITEEKSSPLRSLAKRHDFLFFPHPKNVPGRFSIFSNVTLIPAALLSLNTERFLDGMTQYSKYDLRKLIRFGYTMYRRERKNMVLFPYSERLASFCDWAIQLIAESLGKKRIGITPMKAIGPKDQHSLLQLFLDGPNDKWFVFLSHEPNSGEKIFAKLIQKEQLGVMKTFSEKKRSFVKIHLPKLNEMTMGALFYSFMKFTVEMAYRLKVNPFDQPSVERSKQITRQLF